MALAVALPACLAACGSHHSSAPAGRSAHRSSSTPPLHGPAFGLTEDNADLLWAPGAEQGAARPFQEPSRELTALHPSYLRLLIDWAALQPSRAGPAQLEARVDGCARGIGPCGSYAGVRAELAAIASQQHLASGDFHVVIDVFGAPAWAARGSSGCELAGSTSFARPLRADALSDYRLLVRSLLKLASSEGVALEWWSPWNEPNDPRFISPQRSSCTTGSQALSPAVYGQLARTMAAELRADGGIHHLVLGELNDLEVDSPHTTSVSQFIAGLAPDVLCLSDVWSIHAYAGYGPQAAAADPVGALEAALDGHKCARQSTIWVTEAGAGAQHPGRPRPPGAEGEIEGCQALERQLLGWYADPRVGAVFQYTFREDPDFPVGLLSPDLSHLYPAYNLWLAFSRLRATGKGPPSASACT